MKKVAPQSNRHQIGKHMKKRLLRSALVTIICLQSTALIAADDTMDTRRREAERYLQALPPKEMFADMADKMAVNVPPPEREKVKQTLTAQLNIPAVNRAMHGSNPSRFGGPCFVLPASSSAA